MNNNENKKNLDDVGEEIFVRRDTDFNRTERGGNAAAPKRPPQSRTAGSNRPTSGVATSGVTTSCASKQAVRPSQSTVNPKKTHGKSDKTAIRPQSQPQSISERIKEAKKQKRLKGSGHFELARKLLLVIFSAVGLLSVVLCTVLAYSHNADSIRTISQMTESERSSSRGYVIVYSEAEPWGLGAAETLRDLFSKKTGATLKIVADSEEVAKHEIRVGHTNRASDDYITTLAALGSDGYAVMLRSGSCVDISALSESAAQTAVKYFVDSYVGSYVGGRLTFSRNMSISFVGRSGDEPNPSILDTKIKLSFTETGKFRVLVLSDADINPNTVKAIEAMAEGEKPHLVVFAGDVSSGITSKAELEAYLKALTAPLEERKIPWTAVFGEQDTDGGLSAEAQMEVYTSFEYCIAKSDFSVSGTVSSFLPVYASGEDEKTPVFGIWTMGQTAMISSSSGGAASDPTLAEDIENGTDYGYVTSEQIAFFTESRRLLDRTAGGSLPTVMICHTPVPEFAVIAENPEETRMVGNFGEPVSSSPINTGLFAALLDAGNVLGLYCGHDHLNSFSGRYCGIELGYSASIGYDGYGLGGTFDINNSLRGGRMIELTLRDGTVACSSRMVYAADYGIGLN